MYSAAVKALSKTFGPVCAVVGGQWGDEGKGKLVDILAEEYSLIVRATGGANAGHTIYVGDKKFIFRLIPAGMLHKKTVCIMGNGMVVHIPSLLEEMKVLKNAGFSAKGRLLLSDRAHIVFEYHKIIDKLQEEMKGASKVGTTGRGIGPAYTDKISRMGIRVGELVDFNTFAIHYRANLEFLKKLYGFSFDGEKELEDLRSMLPLVKPLITDTSLFLHNALQKKKKVLLEGANGTLLDVDHGTYPFVTSSNASISGIMSGSGLAPKQLSGVVGIMKAYVTRVGSGPFPSELNDETGGRLREIGGEYGSVTGRPRRCGWFDVVGARYAIRINGFSAINLTKVDVLNSFKKIKIAVAYTYKGKKLTEFPSDIEALSNCKVVYKEMPGWNKDISSAKTFAQLPKECKNYITTLEKLIGCKIACIGTGQKREQMIFRV